MEATQNDVFTIVTNRIIAQLEKQIIPWRKPWTDAGFPRNYVTKTPYSGINVWMLASLGYQQNFFLTWNQLKELGGSVKKGEKAHLVVFFKKIQKKQQANQEESETTSILRYYFVFNIAQCTGLPEIVSIPENPYPVSQIGACEEIIEMMPNCPKIKYGKHMAYYNPIKDYINMPKQKAFATIESFYGTLFHELIHATGHQSRLNRKGIVENTDYASELYSQEELVAEIGACYLNSITGIENMEFDNSVAYINGWLKVLKKDRRMIVYASIQAQKAVEYILDVKPQQKPEVQAEMEIETP